MAINLTIAQTISKYSTEFYQCVNNTQVQEWCKQEIYRYQHNQIIYILILPIADILLSWLEEYITKQEPKAKKIISMIHTTLRISFLLGIFYYIKIGVF